ncbi:hypothetical protein OG735_04380 [Streptomyces sp. NBC_01210]|uniref:hypothetical protein n=1 Tax=Streptomyces sp. NBC_01210 TaxID=2903774 RepID=UPI002E11DA56|nr:hypothetical protein OG735_04380 [Streptomyces sp. NBC_01210]
MFSAPVLVVCPLRFSLPIGVLACRPSAGSARDVIRDGGGELPNVAEVDEPGSLRSLRHRCFPEAL